MFRAPLFGGPTGTPQVNGLAQLGNPNYAHRYYVDATPVAFDLDLNRAGGVFTTTSGGSRLAHAADRRTGQGRQGLLRDRRDRPCRA